MDLNYRVVRERVVDEIFIQRSNSPEGALAMVKANIENGMSGAVDFQRFGSWQTVALCPVCSGDLFEAPDEWLECSRCEWSEFAVARARAVIDGGV